MDVWSFLCGVMLGRMGFMREMGRWETAVRTSSGNGGMSIVRRTGFSEMWYSARKKALVVVGRLG